MKISTKCDGKEKRHSWDAFVGEYGMPDDGQHYSYDIVAHGRTEQEAKQELLLCAQSLQGVITQLLEAIKSEISLDAQSPEELL